jgi:transcriptional regulator with XRE-family HTH domain
MLASNDKRTLRVKSIGNHLARLRAESGLTQLQVARDLGYYTAQFISNWERGISLPPVSAVPVLAKLYGVPRKSLLNTIFEAQMRELQAERLNAMKRWG